MCGFYFLVVAYTHTHICSSILVRTGGLKCPSALPSPSKLMPISNPNLKPAGPFEGPAGAEGLTVLAAAGLPDWESTNSGGQQKDIKQHHTGHWGPANMCAEPTLWTLDCTATTSSSRWWVSIATVQEEGEPGPPDLKVKTQQSEDEV